MSTEIDTDVVHAERWLTRLRQAAERHFDLSHKGVEEEDPHYDEYERLDGAADDLDWVIAAAKSHSANTEQLIVFEFAVTANIAYETLNMLANEKRPDGSHPIRPLEEK